MGKGEEKKEKAKKAEGKIRYIKKFKHGKFRDFLESKKFKRANTYRLVKFFYAGGLFIDGAKPIVNRIIQ